jgi:hypothetical protein
MLRQAMVFCNVISAHCGSYPAATNCSIWLDAERVTRFSFCSDPEHGGQDHQNDEGRQ